MGDSDGTPGVLGSRYVYRTRYSLRDRRVLRHLKYMTVVSYCLEDNRTNSRASQVKSEVVARLKDGTRV